MSRSRGRLPVLVFGLVLNVAWPGAEALAQIPKVRAVLFYSPTCPHCHEVIQRHLPRIFQEYGGEPRLVFDTGRPRREVGLYDLANSQLEILLVDASVAEGYDLYSTSALRFSIPEERRGVPRLIIGDSVLVGSYEIPTYLPDLIERALETGGVDWPDIPGLQAALAGLPRLPYAVVEDDRATQDEEADRAAEATPDAAREPNPPGPGTPPPAEPDEATEPISEAERARRTESEPVRAAEPAEAAIAAETVESLADAPAATPEEPGAAEHEPEVGATGAGTSAAAAEASDAGTSPGGEVSALDAVLDSRPTALENFRRDPFANSISVIVLLAMLASLGLAVVAWRQPGADAHSRPSIGIPALTLVGMAVAAYLAYVESAQVMAVCGPVGDCNTVQQSEYAALFGISVGVIGLLGYAVILAAWLYSRLADDPAARWAKLGLLAMTVVGVVFSIYLTFLEPFVIGATCVWCLTSALIMTLLMWLSLRPAADAWVRRTA